MGFDLSYLTCITKESDNVQCSNKHSTSIRSYYLLYYAKVEGLLASIIFSIDFLAFSGIRRGSNASKNTDGLFTLTSHIISNVRSRPAIVVLISKLGLLESYSLTFDVIKETNYNLYINSICLLKDANTLITF